MYTHINYKHIETICFSNGSPTQRCAFQMGSDLLDIAT